MDPLSDLLALLKPQAHITAGFDAAGDWALALDDLSGRIKCYAVIRGHCWVRTEKEALRIEAGECFVLPSGRRVVLSGGPDTPPRPASEVLDQNLSGNVITVQGGGECYLVGSRFEVNGRHAEALLGTLPTLIRVRTSDGQARLRASLELMMEEVRDARAGSSLMVQQLSHMMLVQALRLHVEQVGAQDVGWLAALADPQIGLAIAAIHAAPGYPWTMGDLARRVGLSRTAFAQRFKDKMGTTPIAYLTRWRMMLAAERMLDTRDSIPEIAASLGYASEYSFATAFRREMGAPPRRYARDVANVPAI
ncbi:AraC family transcriptional regulator [Gallaecimonas mangrovi]|uniref:AraC family transcriptional regulator n=1 Tax=Gallaecimonas mangrovi TaxID=2291597 RepID=UPI000E1FC40A|nr:AraC family transcriptional regulator [Gallaecimonas mangrovi]